LAKKGFALGEGSEDEVAAGAGVAVVEEVASERVLLKFSITSMNVPAGGLDGAVGPEGAGPPSVRSFFISSTFLSQEFIYLFGN
jgi:hypothetical protein